ncbi:hypothetical protein ABK040_006795 [Willaertia magna]
MISLDNISPVLVKAVNRASIPHVEINLIKAINLPVMDIFTSDPYCTFDLGKDVVKSKVIDRSLNPVWNQKLLLAIPDEEIKKGTDLNTLNLRVTLLDRDGIKKDDLISSILLPFSELRPEGIPTDYVLDLPGELCQKSKSKLHFNVTCRNFKKLKNANKTTKHHEVVLTEENTKIQEAKEKTKEEKAMELKLRIEAAKTEDAWFINGEMVGKEEGLIIWRIEKFQVKPWPKEEYGNFYDGDSYIILSTKKVTGESGEKIVHDIHFWIGLYTTQDEYCTAAYKTVELDDLLGGAPVEHREVEGQESDLFLSYFPNGIKILSGGVETGFNRVKPQNYQPRLLHVKGKNSTKIFEKPLHCSELNEGDAFVLDTGLKFLIWEGSSCGNLERLRVHQIANALKSERGNKPQIIVVKGKDVDSEAELDTFYNTLLGTKEDIKSAEEGGHDDSQFEEGGIFQAKNVKIFLLTDRTGKMEFKDVIVPKLSRDIFDQHEVYIIDCGVRLFVWIGKQTSENEKKYANVFALSYIRNFDRPITTEIVRVSSGAEPATFNLLFANV